MRCRLRQALHAEVAVVGNAADHVAGLVHRCDDQPVRSRSFATAQRDVEIAQVVAPRRKFSHLRANLRGQRLLVAGYGGGFGKSREILGQRLGGNRQAEQKAKNRK